MPSNHNKDYDYYALTKLLFANKILNWFEKSDRPAIKIKSVDVMQIMDGIEYEGNVSFDDNHFKYNVKFDLTIRKLEEALRENEDEAKKKIHLDIKTDDGRKINLKEEEKTLFYSTALKHVLNFYSNPITRASQTGLMGRLVRGDKVDEIFGEKIPEWLKIGLGIGSIISYERPMIPELESFLKSYGKKNKEK